MRNADELKTLYGLEYLASVPEGETIVAMAVKEGVLYVTTDKHLYKLVNEKRLEKERR